MFYIRDFFRLSALFCMVLAACLSVACEAQWGSRSESFPFSSDEKEDPVVEVDLLTPSLLSAPCGINLLIQVTDPAMEGVPNLTAESFTIIEEDIPLSNFYLRPREQLPYTMRIVFMLDIGSNITEAELAQEVQAAKAFISQMDPRQKILLCTYSDRIDLVFDPDKGGTEGVDDEGFVDFEHRSLLLTKLDELATDQVPTDLGRALMEGLTHVLNRYDLTEITQTQVLVIAGANDAPSTEETGDLAAALSDQRIFLIGSEAGFQVNQIAELLEAHQFIPINTFEALHESLEQVRQSISDTMNSVYWLFYVSSRRGNETVRLEVDLSGGADSAGFSSTYNSALFYDPEGGNSLGDLYLDLTWEEHGGWGDEENPILLYHGAERCVTPFTYPFQGFTEYTFESSDPMTLQVDADQTNTRAQIVWKSAGAALIHVTDFYGGLARSFHVQTRDDYFWDFSSPSAGWILEQAPPGRYWQIASGKLRCHNAVYDAVSAWLKDPIPLGQNWTASFDFDKVSLGPHDHSEAWLELSIDGGLYWTVLWLDSDSVAKYNLHVEIPLDAYDLEQVIFRFRGRDIDCAVDHFRVGPGP